MDAENAYAALDELLPQSEVTEGSQANPRKRKKSSRACDFCHTNHQPCDNAKPRCSYCQKHGKSCLYLRPQKKRGPAQGYRSALHTMRESAAAWGAALSLIPSLGPVVEGYLKQPEGKRLVKAIRDPQQQEFFIQAWQQSNVFKTFFDEGGDDDGEGEAEGEEEGGYGGGDAGLEADDDTACEYVGGSASRNGSAVNGRAAPQQRRPLMAARPKRRPAPLPSPAAVSAVSAASATSAASLESQKPPPLPPQEPATHLSTPSTSMQPLIQDGTSVFSHAPSMFPPDGPPFSDMAMFGLDQHGTVPTLQEGGEASHPASGREDDVYADFGAAMTLPDILARDAARSSTSFSQTLDSLGFAPQETLNDFLAISYNPDPLETDLAENDASLGSEMDQKAYYELLMGRQFP